MNELARAVVLGSVGVLVPVLPGGVMRAPAAVTEQTWTGRIGDSMCGASHSAHATPEKLTDRQCVIECIRNLADYVLVDEADRVRPIANQDFVGLPLRAGRMVKVTGALQDGAIVITALEPLESVK